MSSLADDKLKEYLQKPCVLREVSPPVCADNFVTGWNIDILLEGKRQMVAGACVFPLCPLILAIPRTRDVLRFKVGKGWIYNVTASLELCGVCPPVRVSRVVPYMGNCKERQEGSWSFPLTAPLVLPEGIWDFSLDSWRPDASQISDAYGIDDQSTLIDRVLNREYSLQLLFEKVNKEFADVAWQWSGK